MKLNPRCAVPVFVEESHQYFVDGVEVPSVSHILKTLKLSKDYFGVDTFYRDRGIAVHKAIELYVHNDLDEKTLDPFVVPYFEGFKKWWEKENIRHPGQQVHVEVPLYSERLGFAGTIDMVLNGFIWDFKCSKDPDRAAELQGAMYQQLWADNFGELLPFRVVRLPWESEKDTIDYHTKDPNIAEWVMGMYRWKMK